jgi:hypothetical protein
VWGPDAERGGHFPPPSDRPEKSVGPDPAAVWLDGPHSRRPAGALAVDALGTSDRLFYSASVPITVTGISRDWSRRGLSHGMAHRGVVLEGERWLAWAEPARTQALRRWS